MKRLQKKLHSQRGASLLLALLMLLVCMMVAASVLAAASSNVGKTRSNQVEQQKYLTVSSAIQLVADEIKKAEYAGRYNVYMWKETTTDSVTGESKDNFYFFCEQVEGVYSCGDFTELVPLKNCLDKFFGRQFTAKGGEAKGYKPLDLSDADCVYVHTLTVELPKTDKLKGYPKTGTGIYQIPQKVTVSVSLDANTNHITLEAWLGEGAKPTDDLVMIAELVLVDNTPLTINYNPIGRTAKAPNSSSGVPLTDGTNPVEWKLHWIKKGGA